MAGGVTGVDHFGATVSDIERSLTFWRKLPGPGSGWARCHRVGPHRQVGCSGPNENRMG